MFQKSSAQTMPDIFSNIYDQLDTQRQKQLNDKRAWHNLFYEYITSKIDESPFARLYDKQMGAPNASARQLIAMIILKEGFGWSDEFLYERTDFDLVVMKALGLNNVNDEVPCIATYYNFKRALYEHQVKTGEDLMGSAFQQLSKAQAKLFGVNGKFARMDSKLIGSNIARCSRLQLVLTVLNIFYKDIKEAGMQGRLETADKDRLEEWSKKKPGQIVYTLSHDEKEKLLEELGYLLLRLQVQFSEVDSGKYHLIVRVLAEQYSIQGKQIILREGKEIKSDSLQSPYDEDAAYRKKKEQKIQGYSINITETCNKEELNLITDVKVEKANCADPDFLQDAVKRSEEVVGHIEHVNTDGAYHSQSNQEFTKSNETELILGGFPGKEGNYDFEIKSEEEVLVSNKHTGEVHCAKVCKGKNGETKYRIREENKLRYFTLAFLLSWQQRQSAEQIPQSERNRRNNVEASIFQFCYHSRNNKTRYRGLIKHQHSAYSRCLWINLIRIKNYVAPWKGEMCPDKNEKSKNQALLTKSAEILTNVSGYFTSGNEKSKNQAILTKSGEMLTNVSGFFTSEIDKLFRLVNLKVFGSERVTPLELSIYL